MVHGKPYLIGVKKWELAITTLSASVIQAVTIVGIRFEAVIAIVSHSAAY